MGYRVALQVLVLALALPAAARTQVTLARDADVYTFESPHFHLEVDAAAGGRIRSWVPKPSGKEMVALWKGAGEIGGVLDDRSFFTGMRYDAAIMRPGPDTAVLRLEARHSSGLSVLKILTACKEFPGIQVQYELCNGTQAPQRLWVRSFLLPGARPRGPDHLYWVSAAGGKSVEGSPDASNYYPAGTPPLAALWHRETGDGIAAFTPGADRFYFWRDSRENPTFEWIYPDVPPGQILRAGATLAVVSGLKDAPDWRALAESYPGPVQPAALAPLPGWTDEAARFGVTEEDRRRGLWLSVGADAGRQRLPDPLPLDLPRDDDRYVSIALNPLREFAAPVSVTIPSEWQGQVCAFRETESPERRELLPLPAGAVSFHAGAREMLWLRIGSRGRAPGEYRIPLALAVGENTFPVTIALRVWPVTLSGWRPFHVRGYYSGLSGLSGGYEITDARLKNLHALLAAYAEMGGDVLDWVCVWHEIVARTKLAGTGESLAEVAKKTPERIDLDHLPRLDFSYFDPWLDACKRHGVIRLETYMEPLDSSRWQWILLDPAVGKGRVKAETAEGRRVIAWFYREMHRYFEEHGFQGFFCKISDEISPEHIPAYRETARLAREAGWRPFTTITGMVARTAEHIRMMDPECDEWQLAFCLKDDFLALLRKRYTVRERSIPLQGKWGSYTNGGAEATWGMKAFGPESATGVDPKGVESLELLEDGRPLALSGGSPWGNKTRGQAFTSGSLGAWLYVSPADGADPAGHRYLARIKVREESPQGTPLISPDRTDEIWCYGGGSSPYRGSYESAYAYPATTLYQGLRGFGQWAFYWWQKTERVVWLDEATSSVTLSPAYCGYRDGYRDALLLGEWISRRGRAEYEAMAGEGDGKLLRFEPRSTEVYRYVTLVNGGDPTAINAARRHALQRLSTPQSTGTSPARRTAPRATSRAHRPRG